MRTRKRRPDPWVIRRETSPLCRGGPSCSAASALTVRCRLQGGSGGFSPHLLLFPQLLELNPNPHPESSQLLPSPPPGCWVLHHPARHWASIPTQGSLHPCFRSAVPSPRCSQQDNRINQISSTENKIQPFTTTSQPFLCSRASPPDVTLSMLPYTLATVASFHLPSFPHVIPTPDLHLAHSFLSFRAKAMLNFCRETSGVPVGHRSPAFSSMESGGRPAMSGLKPQDTQRGCRPPRVHLPWVPLVPQKHARVGDLSIEAPCQSWGPHADRNTLQKPEPSHLLPTTPCLFCWWGAAGWSLTSSRQDTVMPSRSLRTQRNQERNIGNYALCLPQWELLGGLGVPLTWSLPMVHLISQDWFIPFFPYSTPLEWKPQAGRNAIRLGFGYHCIPRPRNRAGCPTGTQHIFVKWTKKLMPRFFLISSLQNLERFP